MPNPGAAYPAESREAFVPHNLDGRKLVDLLIRAWQRGMTFSIGTSVTTGRNGVVVWTGIPHKTAVRGGPPFAYPDRHYVQECLKELKARGIRINYRGN